MKNNTGAWQGYDSWLTFLAKSCQQKSANEVLNPSSSMFDYKTYFIR